MRILNLFNQYLERGGEAVAVEAICASLSHVSEVERLDFYSSDWTGPGAPPAWQQALRMWRNPATIHRLRDSERGSKSDLWLVHNVFPVGSAAIYREAQRLEIPVVQYLHNYRPFSVNGYLWAGNRLAPQGLTKNYWPEISAGAWQNSRVKTAWLASVLTASHLLGWWRSVKVWIAISDFVKDKFISAGIPAEKVVTLRHFWRPGPAPEAASGNHYLFLGRLTEAKGVKVLLDAWEKLEAEKGGATPLLCIAGEGPLRSYVQSRAASAGSIQFLGEISGDAKAEALRCAKAVIVPSIWWEPLGLVVYEGYEYERPVLAARSGGLPEIVLEGETGLLHEPGDSATLAAQVMSLEEHPEKSQSMGQAGRQWLIRNADETQWQRRFQAIADLALA
ncbi:MAG: glycosyltransferase family 4 protein [Chthoniobacterales bacterium]|nr:glycosyltransferase family 4 protein [Chthoniobacterales bacterium]